MNRFSVRRHLGSARKTVRNEGMTPGFVLHMATFASVEQLNGKNVGSLVLQKHSQMSFRATNLLCFATPNLPATQGFHLVTP